MADKIPSRKNQAVSFSLFLSSDFIKQITLMTNNATKASPPKNPLVINQSKISEAPEINRVPQKTVLFKLDS